MLLAMANSYAQTFQVKTDILGRKQIYQDGSLIATAKNTREGITQYFDNDYEPLGHSSVIKDGTVVYYNAQNEFVGSSKVAADGVTYYYDSSEKLIGTSKTEPNNALMFFDVMIKRSPTEGGSYTRSFAM